MAEQTSPVGVFINYRRQTDLATAGRLLDNLRHLLPETAVFMDVDSIPAGRDFVAELAVKIGQCDVFLPIIGIGWLDVKSESGHRRIDDADDFVRFEIETALRFGRHVVPVLIGDARMPSERDVPSSIVRLSKLNAVTIRHENFLRDCQVLADKIRPSLSKANVVSPAQRLEIAAFALETNTAQQLVREKPPGWEFLLTAELWESYLREPIRRARDLSSGLISIRRVIIRDEEEALAWLGDQLGICDVMIDPLKGVMEEEFVKAWGLPGVAGNPHEILHACRLVRTAVDAIVSWEENIRSHQVPDKLQRLHSLLTGVGSRQVLKLEALPNVVRQGVKVAVENPTSSNQINFTVTFDLPPNWVKDVDREMRRLKGGWSLW